MLLHFTVAYYARLEVPEFGPIIYVTKPMEICKTNETGRRENPADQGGVVVTDAMIEAGLLAMSVYNLGDISEADAVKAVFLAMAAASSPLSLPPAQ